MSTDIPLSPVEGSDYSGDATPADRESFIDWAHRAAAAGRVETTSPLNSQRVTRNASLDAPESGESGAVLLLANEAGEVSDIDFDFGDRAYRHLMHDDGLGVTLCDHRSVPWVHYRIVSAS